MVKARLINIKGAELTEEQKKYRQRLSTKKSQAKWRPYHQLLKAVTVAYEKKTGKKLEGEDLASVKRIIREQVLKDIYNNKSNDYLHQLHREVQERKERKERNNKIRKLLRLGFRNKEIADMMQVNMAVVTSIKHGMKQADAREVEALKAVGGGDANPE